MSEPFALLLLNIITAAGAVLWLGSLVYLVVSSRADLVNAEGDEDDRDWLDAFEAVPAQVVTGSAEVEGTPAALSTRAAAQLARMGSSGMLKIVDRRDDRLAFEGTGLFPALGLGRHSQVVLRFRSAGRERTRINYRAALSRSRPLIWAGGFFVFLGFVGLVGGYLAMRTYIVPNPSTAIRAQVVQMVQVIHVLWPPFLLGFLHRRPRTMLRGQLDVLIHNLPYLDLSGPSPLSSGRP